MDTTLSLQSNLYPRITPAGAYYAVSNNTASASRTLLHGLLKSSANELISPEKLLAWTDSTDIETSLSLLYRLQRLEFLYGEENPQVEEQNFSDDQLPELLEQLSSVGKALLADPHGSYFANAEINHKKAEEVSILANEIAALGERHQLLLKKNLNIHHNAWGICEPSGQSELTFFPLYVGRSKLILVVGGVPDLNKEAFVALIKVLCNR